MDEKDTTLEWLQIAQESFAYNVENGDYQGCLAVISDVNSQGYEKESQDMQETLRQVPLERFAKVTPYEY